MEKLQQLLNFTNKDGEVVTYFDGKVTQSQVIALVLCVIGVVLVIRLLRGVLKSMCIVGVCCIFLVWTGLASPDELRDTAMVIKEKGVQIYRGLADASEDIRMDGFDLEVRVGGEWYSVRDIKSVVSIAKDKLSIVLDGKNFVVEDSDIVGLINSLR